MVANENSSLPLLFFFHIPKTAGMSLRLAFANIYPRSLLYPYGNFSEIPKGSVPRIDSSVRLIAGHFNFSLLNSLTGWKSLVVLRDPISLCISSIRHAARDVNYGRSATALLQGKTAQQIVESDSIMNFFSNTMCKYLCEDTSFEDCIGLELDYNIPVCSRKSLYRLQLFDYMMDLSSLQADFENVTRDLRIPYFRSLPRVNNAKKQEHGLLSDDKMTPEILSVLKERNAEDCALYSSAVHIKYAKTALGELKLNLTQGLIHKHYSSFSVDITEPLPGDGFFSYESSPFRWVGANGDRFTLNSALDESTNWILTLSIPLHNTSLAGLHSMKFYVNGYLHSHFICAREFWIVELKISKYLLRAAGGLCFIVCYFKAHDFAIPLSRDKRSLAFRVSGIQFNANRPTLNA